MEIKTSLCSYKTNTHKTCTTRIKNEGKLILIICHDGKIYYIFLDDT